MSPDTREKLLSAGFDLEPLPRFERQPPIFEDRIGTLTTVCQCDRTRIIEQTVYVLAEVKGRRFFACQCARCRVVNWAPWINRTGVYHGPTKVRPSIQNQG